jgi:acyl-CoA dehydrogenase
MDTLLLDAFTKLLATGCSTATVRAAETGTDCTELHRAIAEAGFLDALLPEDAGGGGLSLADVFPLVMACGEHLLPLPFAETLIARALVHAGGARLPDHARVVLAGAGPLLPQSGLASHALLDADGELQLLPLRDTVSLFRLPLRMPDSSAAPVMRVKGTGAELGLAAAAITAALMAGAMKRVLAMTLEHIGQREQFGRKIGQFQAVQQQAAVLGEEVLSVQVAARAGFGGSTFTLARSAMAKTRASEASHRVCDIAHALHGAIGATLEYDLQLFTRRIKHWQLAFGGESYWSRRLAAVYLDAPDRPVIDFIRHALGDTPEPSA